MSNSSAYYADRRKCSFQLLNNRLT